MAAPAYYTLHNTSRRGLAMGLAILSAVVLSPLYIPRTRSDRRRYYRESRWGSSSYSSGGQSPVVAMLLVGLILAIKTSSLQRNGSSLLARCDPSWVLRVGSSAWGIAGVLALLMLVLCWRD